MRRLFIVLLALGLIGCSSSPTQKTSKNDEDQRYKRPLYFPDSTLHADRR